MGKDSTGTGSYLHAVQSGAASAFDALAHHPPFNASSHSFPVTPTGHPLLTPMLTAASAFSHGVSKALTPELKPPAPMAALSTAKLLEMAGSGYSPSPHKPYAVPPAWHAWALPANAFPAAQKKMATYHKAKESVSPFMMETQW